MKRFLFTGLFIINLLIVDLAIARQAPWLYDYADSTQAKAAKHNIPGYALVFVEKGKPEHIFTFGKTSRKGAPISEDTVFRLASVSKTFTGMAIAKLAEQKAINWDTPVSKLAPEFGFATNGRNDLTVRHIVGQASGYMPNAYDNLIEANYPLPRVLNMLADLEPLCTPGKCYTYQNALFGVFEHYFDAQNTSYRAVLNREILKPLGMPTASAGLAALLSSDEWAKPHIAIRKDKWREGKVKKSYYRYSPAAGVNASIKDMTIWLRAMLGEYPHVISDSLIEQVTTPVVKTSRELRRRDWKGYLNDAHYGLGWRIYDFKGQPLIYHGGWVQGYRAAIAFAPEQQVGFAILMNAESNTINGLTAAFWADFFTQYATLAAKQEKTQN
ncbi:beta-lactamase family protein [Aestuariibacter sp. AA17]|uniref:Beta-lactamase family protein n=1 Tax=Fluctibacter corallii TaxID=2984329 RepID=A0ABT3AAK4_9ALTE|nr:serine hydrolase domain-containing protein [Aestuariibacter sp. AA17]MCV2885701.1 beta-lactamase family protein [Aestuariibacter sp. AA17]